MPGAAGEMSSAALNMTGAQRFARMGLRWESPKAAAGHNWIYTAPAPFWPGPSVHTQPSLRDGQRQAAP